MSPDRDRDRGLDSLGRADAVGLSEVLATYGVDCIATSPYARCVETVEPLAALLGLDIALMDELAPGTPRGLLDGALARLGHEMTVACTHRETFETLFGDEVLCEKGAGWFLEQAPEGWRARRHFASPASSSRVLYEAALAHS